MTSNSLWIVLKIWIAGCFLYWLFGKDNGLTASGKILWLLIFAAIFIPSFWALILGGVMSIEKETWKTIIGGIIGVPILISIFLRNK